jgi:hypothetical protein
MVSKETTLLQSGGLWLGLAKDSLKVIISFIAGASTYFGQPVHPFFRDNWALVGLGCALVMAIYILIRRERDRSVSASIEGIVQAWPRRESLDSGRVMKALEQSQTISMLGYNLRTPFLSHGGRFDEMLRGKLAKEKNLTLRILIADPDSEGLARRAEFEAKRPDRRMHDDGNSALEYLNDILRTHADGRLEVRLIDGDLIRCSLIFADEKLFVTQYLARRTGNKCPAFEIHGKSTGFYQIYQREFDDLWKEAQPHSPP